jgi:hypothetical protein
MKVVDNIEIGRCSFTQWYVGETPYKFFFMPGCELLGRNIPRVVYSVQNDLNTGCCVGKGSCIEGGVG